MTKILKIFSKFLLHVTVGIICFTEIIESHFLEKRFWLILFSFPLKIVIELMLNKVS